jgi:hypothetical protein
MNWSWFAVVDVLSFFLAQATDNTAEPPDTGTGIPIIVGVLAALVIGGFLLHLFVAKRSKASKGGVQPPLEERGQRHPGEPPVESVEPRS